MKACRRPGCALRLPAEVFKGRVLNDRAAALSVKPLAGARTRELDGATQRGVLERDVLLVPAPGEEVGPPADPEYARAVQELERRLQ